MEVTDIYALEHHLLLQAKATNETKGQSLLRLRSANAVMREAATLPPLRHIAGPLWHEDEVTILFAPSGLGKSILAVQIAIQCAGGERIASLPMQAETGVTLYCDFELSDRSYAQRYTDECGTLYRFPDNLKRVDFRPDFIGHDANERLLTDLENAIVESKARYVIVDNISAMKGTLESGKDAGGLFMSLKQMKQRHGVSMLIVAHTPKRDASQPLTVNDLAGSSQISNLADSVFALGRSTQGMKRVYVKQVKTRNDEVRYGDDNVLLFDKTKTGGYLHLEYVGTGTEREHLPKREEARHEREEEIQELLKDGHSQRKVAEMTGVSVGTVNTISKRSGVQRVQGVQSVERSEHLNTEQQRATPTIAPIDPSTFDNWQQGNPS